MKEKRKLRIKKKIIVNNVQKHNIKQFTCNIEELSHKLLNLFSYKKRKQFLTHFRRPA